jgi:hypothetical protein
MAPDEISEEQKLRYAVGYLGAGLNSGLTSYIIVAESESEHPLTFEEARQRAREVYEFFDGMITTQVQRK